MEEYEIIELIRNVIRQELAPILMGKIVSTESTTRATAQRFSGENQIGNMRLLFPYGFVSRPPAATECVVMPIASDPSHLNVLSQFDSNRPSIAVGESCLYGPDGQVVYMKSGGIVNLGSLSASHPVGLADIIKTRIEAVESALSSLISTFNGHDHPYVDTPRGPSVTQPPLAPASDYTADSNALGSTTVNVMT
jgi:phage gp45-like